jgi:peptidoglycan hydrolase-like protein with peptidoglycan-binding domain
MIYYIRHFLVIAGLFGLFGCDRIYAMLDEKGAQEKQLVGESVPLEANPTIEEIQVLLSVYGYGPGKIDGVLGLRTRDAVAKFQQDMGLEVTRKVDDLTWQQLKVFQGSDFIKDKQLNVEYLQRALQKAGYNPGAIDGRMGAQITQAIKAFQKKNGLKVDGKVGYQTIKALSPPVVQ